jgi:hypothetical protein
LYLLDTNIISELRRLRPRGAVLAWLIATDDADLHISAVTIGELQAGVENTRRHDATRATEIEAWVDRIVIAYDILPMDTATFRCWARLMRGQAERMTEDAMVAATAIVHGLTVVTRNVRDFKPFGVKTLNPFAAR